MLINNEDSRLKELYSYNILDSLPGDYFDSIVELASFICEAPISLITFIDKDRQWIKSKVGVDISETPRNVAFCNHTILQENILEVEDATCDERFKNNPFVINEPKIRFYAGNPLITKNGYALGSLCVIDYKPKKLSNDQRKALENLAKQVMFNIEARKNLLIFKENEQSYTSIFEGTSDLIHILNSEGKILKVNNSWKRLLEYNDEEIKNLNLFDVIHEESFEHCINLFSCIKSNQIDCPDKVIYSMKTKSGKKITVEGSVIVERDNNGNLKLIKSILRDITEKINLENELKISEKKFRNIYELSPVGIALNDFKTGDFIDVNNSFANSTGYSKEEIYNLSYWDLTPKEYQEKEMEQLRLLNTYGKYGPYEKEYIHKQGYRYPVLLSGVKFTDIDNKEYILSVIQDITEIKKYQKSLEEAKQKAIDANKAKSMFLANMSHEIRTPLNSIIGFSDLMMKTNLDEDQKQYMTNVFQSANFLLGLINDILDFSKIESRKMELSISEVSILELLKEISHVVKYSAHKKDVELIFDYPMNLNDIIYIDYLRFKQVLINLLNNAIKFTSSGDVTLKVELLEELDNNLKKFRFSVIDTGIGISEKDIKKIFNPFKQADYSINKKYAGTGLGLSISKKLLKLMNSKLKVESELGKGSNFYFDIVVKSLSKNNQEFNLNIEEKILVLSNYKKNLDFLKKIFDYLNINAMFLDNTDNINGEFDLIILDNNFENIQDVLDKFQNSKLVILNNSCREKIVKENVLKNIVKPIFKDDIINIFTNNSNNLKKMKM
ncbi:MAG: hypothetical protein KatS3mg068_1327 [Candidatus Sericytochromatia bacterium]|nr:MAG: hypothetical protein KatS3mg068_1327 [Candidatus Sericytochromatia bacterium]